MAGHSKWSKVKRIKGALDVKRGALFSKLSKEIVVAAKIGGGDPDGNARLRSAILTARAQNMPNDNIDRAVRKGAGELDGAAYEEIVYEGYAPGGVAVLVEAATDNKNRTAADLRRIFSKNNGNLAASGSVSYMFHRKGQLTVPASALDEDRLLEIVLEAGAEELVRDEDQYVITTAQHDLYAVGEALRARAVALEEQKLTFVADTLVTLDDPQLASQVLRLCEELDENDDVQHVHANFDLAAEANSLQPA